MNGLEISKKISKLSNEIGALGKVISIVEGDRGYSYECRVLKTIKQDFEKEKTSLEDKLKSVNF